ncbi:MAG: hypothetical protein PVF53_12965, partial [Desulfobacterales bacterium]
LPSNKRCINNRTKNSKKNHDVEHFCDIMTVSSISLERDPEPVKNVVLLLPFGKADDTASLSLSRVCGPADSRDSFALERLKATASSTFATSW